MKKLLARVSVMVAMVSACLVTGQSQAATDPTTLKMVPYADLKILDPSFTTAYVSRNFGYLVYDTLFAMDAKGKPQPEMVAKYSTSSDGKTWTFTLRDGLKFSDGSALTAADCVASLNRWMARDNIGMAMAADGGKWTAVDAKTLTLTLTKPYGLVLDGLAKVSSFPAFIMPTALATLPTSQPINQVLGSGPYVFERSQWMPGSKIIFKRNPNYVGPTAAASGLSGNKAPATPNLEWDILPDANSAVAALTSGEIDMIEQVPADYIQKLRQDANITVKPMGIAQVYMVMNQKQPPFNDPRMRLAVAHLVDQNAVTAAMGYPDDMRMQYCDTVFVCGGPYQSKAGSAAFANPDVALAKKLLTEAGYKGQKITVLLPTDVAYLNAATLVMVQAMQQAGMNVDLQSMDWATETARRASDAPVSKGGWNIFVSSAAQFNLDSPVTNTYLGAACGNTLPGWPCDQQLDSLRTQWQAATDPVQRQKLLDAFQERAYQVIPVLPLGQYDQAFAVRKSVQGADKIWGLPNVWVLKK